MGQITEAEMLVMVKARFSEKRLRDLTNQDIRDAADITDAKLKAAFFDADLMFQTKVGDYTSQEYAHDYGAMTNLMMVFLYIYAGESQHMNFYYSIAAEFMIKGYGLRRNIDPLTPEAQNDQEFSNRVNMIQSIPRPRPDANF